MATIWLNSTTSQLKTSLLKSLENDTVTGVMIDSNKEESLDTESIKSFCDMLMDRYDDGDDGFVCLALDRKIAYDTKKLVEKAKEIAGIVDKENFMIAIPATKEGIEAIEKLSNEQLNLCATHIFSPNQASLALSAMENLGSNLQGILAVNVASFDKLLNPSLVANRLSKDRVGFFNAIKILNQTNLKGFSNIKVLFSDITIHQSWLEPEYYLKQLNLHNAILDVPQELFEEIDFDEIGEAFEFQTKHIDAFFSYLTPANISIQATYETLLKESLS